MVEIERLKEIKDLEITSSTGRTVEEILKDYLDSVEESINLQKLENAQMKERLKEKYDKISNIDNIYEELRKRRLISDFNNMKEKITVDFSDLEEKINKLKKEEFND